MLLPSPVNSIHRDMTRAYFDNRLQSQDFSWEIRYLISHHGYTSCTRHMLMTERAETELFLGKFNILYLHGYPDTRIHMCKQIFPFTSRGHPCVLQPDISVIELQFWVNEGRKKTEKELAVLAVYSHHTL